MSLSVIAEIGRWERETIGAFGRFWIFVWHTVTWMLGGATSRRNWRLLMP